MSEPIVLGFEEWMMADLTALVKSAYDESEWMRSMSYSENRVQEMIATAIFQPERVCGFSCADIAKKEVVGFIVATASGLSFSEEPIASDVLSYVKKEYRESSAPGLLLEAYEKWAARKGVKKIFFTNNGMFRAEPFLTESWKIVSSRAMRSI